MDNMFPECKSQNTMTDFFTYINKYIVLITQQKNKIYIHNHVFKKNI